jgi:hypothetical protein
VPREPNASQQIYLEVPQRFFVADVSEVLRFVDAQIVHEDIKRGPPLSAAHAITVGTGTLSNDFGLSGAKGPRKMSKQPVISGGFYRIRENFMEQIAAIERAVLLTRIFFRIGARLFGQVPTLERFIANRLSLMSGLGGLYGAIEWFGKIDVQLRALLNVQVATFYGSLY